MEAIAVIILLAAVAAGIFGIINLIKPLGFMRINRRRHGAAVLGGSVVVFFLAALLGAAAQPGGLQAGVEKAEAERRAEAKAKPAAAPAAAPQPAGVTQADMDRFYSEVQQAVGPCDARVSAAVDAMAGGDAYVAFPIVQAAESTCLSTSSEVGSIDIPRAAKGEVKKAFQDAREACALSGTIKWSAMGKVKKVVNGDMRPSAVSAATSELESTGSYTMRCAVAVGIAAVKAGVKVPGGEAEAAT